MARESNRRVDIRCRVQWRNVAILLGILIDGIQILCIRKASVNTCMCVAELSEHIHNYYVTAPF